MRKQQCFLIAYTLPCTPIPVVKTATSSAGSKSMICETLTDLDASAPLLCKLIYPDITGAPTRVQVADEAGFLANCIATLYRLLLRYTSSPNSQVTL